MTFRALSLYTPGARLRPVLKFPLASVVGAKFTKLLIEKFVDAPSMMSTLTPWTGWSVVASTTVPVIPPPAPSAKSSVAVPPAGTVTTSAVPAEGLLSKNTRPKLVARARTL